jgi:hypothetical protein
VHAVTPTSRITFGFNADLNLATAEALKTMLTWMQSLFGMDRTGRWRSPARWWTCGSPR